MANESIAVGVFIPETPPLSDIKLFLRYARLTHLDTLVVADHIQDFYPRALWDSGFSWLASQCPSPHALYDFQTLLGYAAAHAGRVRLGVGVTEPIRRHPVLIAQALITLAHLTMRPPILGLGSGERENTEPYGLDFSHPVDRLEEALQIIRLCLSSQECIDFSGAHYRLHRAVMDLQPPPGRTPAIWIAANGPRMLRLTGTYGDGWFPHMVGSPEAYATKLQVVLTAAREAGRDGAAITPSMGQYVVVAPTEQRARALLEARSIRYLGLLVPAEQWRAVGAVHPFGPRFRGFVDILPEHYDRQTLERALATVPPEVIDRAVIWGTPGQVAGRLREFGDAGMRQVCLILASSRISRGDALYGFLATYQIARLLRRGREQAILSGTRAAG
jgi:phthiodiolone/phenolphthiodiolone dimycocerosates ketoreductase